MAPVGLTIVDHEGRYLYINSTAAEVIGLKAEAHLGRRIQDIFPAVWPNVAPFHRQVFDTAKPVDGGVMQGDTLAHPGQLRSIKRLYQPLLVDAEVKAVAIYVSDVTDTERAETARREVEARFLSFMTNMPGAAWMKDSQGRYVYTNASNKDALDVFRTCHPGILTDVNLPPGTVAGQLSLKDRKALAGEVIREVEAVPQEDGLRHFLVAKFPVAGASDGAEYVGGVAVDITERLRAEEALVEKSQHLEKAMVDLAEASRIKDDFLGMVSHELRTPITTILGNASVLVRRQNVLSPGERYESLSDLYVDAKRLNQIVENLLVLARLESGKEVEAEPALVSRAIRRVLQEARKSNPGREYRFQGVSKEPIAAGVELYIEQVMRNYLSNAAKYSDSKTRIDVTLRSRRDDVCVRVLDRGVGLAHEDFENVFQPFYRSVKTAETTSGVGIGLTVCKRLIEAQGGRVWASTRPGGGMEFGFSIPVAPDED